MALVLSCKKLISKMLHRFQSSTSIFFQSTGLISFYSILSLQFFKKVKCIINFAGNVGFLRSSSVVVNTVNSNWEIWVQVWWTQARRSGFKFCPGQGFVLQDTCGQDTFLSQCRSPPRIINKHPWTIKKAWPNAEGYQGWTCISSMT